MKVLIAEDHAESRRMLELMFQRWGYDVHAYEDGTAAWERASAPDAPPLVILDWRLPGMDGLEICRGIRARHHAPYAYIILISGRTAREDVLEGMAAGADDYIRKPIDYDELQVRVRAARRIIDLHQTLYAASEALRERATRDSLTGLWNRHETFATLEREIDRAARERTRVGLILIDVDHFKRINDQYGHLAGDDVLRALAPLLVSLIRPYDAVGRYGGEEFVMLLPGCTEADARHRAERIREAVATLALPIPGRKAPITVSAGVAISDGSADRSALALFAAADAALYRAKADGRNAVRVATPEEYGESAGTVGSPRNSGDRR